MYVPTTQEDEARTNPKNETGHTPKPRPGNDSAGQAVRWTCQELKGPLVSRIEDLEETLPRATKMIDTIQDRFATMESRYQAPDANITDNPQLSQADIFATFWDPPIGRQEPFQEKWIANRCTRPTRKTNN